MANMRRLILIFILIFLNNLLLAGTLKYCKGGPSPWGLRNRNYDWGYGLKFGYEAGLVQPVRILGAYIAVYPVPYGSRYYRFWILKDSSGFPTTTNPYLMLDTILRIERDTMYFVRLPEVIISETSFFFFVLSKDTLMSTWGMDSMHNGPLVYWKKDTIFHNLGRLPGDLQMMMIVEFLTPGIKEIKKLKFIPKKFDILGRKLKLENR